MGVAVMEKKKDEQVSLPIVKSGIATKDSKDPDNELMFKFGMAFFFKAEKPDQETKS